MLLNIFDLKYLSLLGLFDLSAQLFIKIIVVFLFVKMYETVPFRTNYLSVCLLHRILIQFGLRVLLELVLS